MEVLCIVKDLKSVIHLFMTEGKSKLRRRILVLLSNLDMMRYGVSSSGKELAGR